MPSACQLLVLDLDGTLLGPDGTVSPANCAAVARARDAGVEIVVATGRMVSECTRALDAIEHEGALIAASGALLAHGVSRETHWTKPLGTDVVAHATPVLTRAGHRVLLLMDRDAVGYDYLAVGDAPLDQASAWWFEHHDVTMRECSVEAFSAENHPTLRLGIVGRDLAMPRLASDLLREVGDRASVLHWSAVTAAEATGSATHLLEIFGHNVNKCTAVEALLVDRDFGLDAVVAIGDGLNDVEMLEGAGIGIAMENAIPEARAVADRFTESHCVDGVARAIDRLLDGTP